MKDNTPWPVVPIAEVALKEKGSIQMGPFGSQLKKNELVSKGIRVLFIENIVTNSFVYGEGKFITENKYEQLKGFQVRPGDVLITMMGTIGRCAVVPDDIGKAIISSHLLKIRPDLTLCDPEFLKRAILAEGVKRQFEKWSHGQIMVGLNTGIIRKTRIPLPPLPTQRRIVAILEKAEELKRLRGQSLKDTDELVKSVFLEMFGDPMRNEKQWKLKRIDEIGTVVSGSTPKTNHSEYWEGPVNWVTPAELLDGDNYYYYETERKISEVGLYSIGGRLFPKNTVMLTTRAPIGKVAIAGNEMCSNQGFKNIVCDETIMNPVYLYAWLLLNKAFLNSMGTGATFKEINKKNVEQISIPTPPLPLQKQFAKKVALIESLKGKHRTSNQDISQLFDALMQKAFKGELVA